MQINMNRTSCEVARGGPYIIPVTAMQKFCNVWMPCVDAAASAALATLTLSACHSMDSCYRQLSTNCAAVRHTLLLHFFASFPSKKFLAVSRACTYMELGVSEKKRNQS